MQTKLTVVALLLAGALIGGVLFFPGGNENGKEPARTFAGTSRAQTEGTATLENGVQYVAITARGGYAPRTTKATAGIPTVIRMKTENTYDCSMALVIPALSYQSYLKPTGVEEIEIPADKAKGTLEGLCSMAMYHFKIEFE